MRVYISVDLEGVNGVCHSSHTQPGEAGYERAVGLMHQELAAVVSGAKKAGAKEIVVNDSHWDMRNLRTEMLPEGVHLVSGWQKPFSMVSGVGGKATNPALSGGAYDCAIFLGYHAMAGTACGVLSHTYRAQVFLNVKLNGKPAGETALNAMLAGSYGVPVALVTGDDALCREAQDTLGKVHCVCVKQAVSRYSAIFRPHKDVIAELESKTAEALKDRNSWALLKPQEINTVTITCIDPAMADGAELLPMVKRLDDRTIEVSEKDFTVAFRLMLAIGAIGASRKDPYF